MSLEPEPDDEVGSEGSGGHLDEIDLIEYEQDPWNDADDFLYQQQQRVGACKAHGFLLAGKPGAGKTHLAGKLAAELGAVHVGLPQILAQCVEAYVVKQEYEGLQAKIDAEKNKAPPEPAAPSTEEGAYNDEGGEAAAAEDGAEQPPGPDEEQIEKWSEEQKTVLKRWSTLHLPKRQFEAAPEFCEAAALLMAGKAVEGDLLGRLLTARLRAEDVQFRGYVLESLPPPLLPDLLLQPGLPKLDYVLMLELTDKEALDRLESLQLEPVSNMLFSLGDRTPGEHQPLVPKVDADGNPAMDEEGQPVMVHETPEVTRWVKRSNEMRDNVTTRMEQYARIVESDAWRAALEQLLPGCLIRLDASLPPHRLLASAKQALGFETYPIVHPPRVLQGEVFLGGPDEAEPEPRPLEELLKNVAPGGEESGNQTLSLSAWGCFCPVALTDHGAKALGLAVSRSHEANRALMLDCSMTGEDGVAKPKFVAEYCGKVFMLSSPLALQIFCANPLPYVSSKPGWTTGSFRSGSWDPEAQAPLPRLRVLVVGPPCAGKTEVAKAIADRYGALHVDALKALELTLLDSSPLALEVSSAMGEGRGLTPGLMTRLLASQLNLPEPEMPEPPPPVEPPEPAEGEEAPAPPEPFVPPVWQAKGEPVDLEMRLNGVVEWGKAPDGQESLRFVLDGLPLDVLEKEDGTSISPAVHALRTAALVPTVVLVLDDVAPEGVEDAPASVGRERTEHAKEAGFFFNLGREAALEREKGVQYPFDEACMLQSQALAPDGVLCQQLTEAGALVVRLDARLKLAELVEAAAARVDPLVYGKPPVSDGKVLGATKIEGFAPHTKLGDKGDDGAELPEPQGLQVFGHLKSFCPVTWRRKSKLVPGRPEFVAQWRGLLYCFKGEAELGVFLENPSYFAPAPTVAPEHRLNRSVDGSEDAIPGMGMSMSGLYEGADGGASSASKLPPLRLMLVGPLGSERHKHVADMAAAHQLEVLNLQALLPPEPPPPPTTATEEEKAAAKKEWLPEDLAQMAQALSDKLSTPPLSQKAVLLEGEAVSEGMMDALLACNLHPTLCILLKMSAEEALPRVYGSKEVTEYPKPHRLPFYPYLDPRRQRRQLRALKAIGVEPPNPHPRNPETGKPIDPAPTKEELHEAALAAETAIKERLMARLTSTLAGMEAIKAKLLEHCVPVKTVNVLASAEKKALALERITARYLKHVYSSLASPVAVSPAKAAELLDARVRRWSKFGSCCPVMLARYNRVVSPNVKCALAESFPVVYGPHIYLCKTGAAREAFMADAVPMSTQRPAQPPALHRMVVLGAPKSGKTSLASSLARELGVKHIDAVSAVEEVVQGISHLGARVKKMLRSGQALEPLVVAECVCAVAMRFPGWVLDGFPVTREQAELLAARNLDITRVIVMEVEAANVTARADAELQAKNAAGLYRFPTPTTSVPDTREEAEEGAMVEVPGAEALLTGAKAIDKEMDTWNAENAAVQLALLGQRDVQLTVAADGNRTHVHRQVRQDVVSATLGRQAYLEKRRRGHPAPMLHMHLWTDRDEIKSRRSRFSPCGGGGLGGSGGGDYCPVAWKLERTLELVPADRRLDKMVRIGAQLVCVSDRYRRELLASPNYYMRGAPLPEDLPRKLEMQEALALNQDGLDYKGYCPVTLWDGPGTHPETKEPLPIQEALRKPATEDLYGEAADIARSYVVEYAGRKFRMLSQEKLERFMRTPWKFVDLKLPVKLPLEVKAVDLTKLPLVGYLEQTVVDQLTNALLSLGRSAPRFPGRTGQESALKYLALHLRANNNTNSSVDARLHAANLQAFKEACAVLTRDAKGAQLPTPLPPAHPEVDRYFQLRADGPKSCAPN